MNPESPRWVLVTLIACLLALSPLIQVAAGDSKPNSLSLLEVRRLSPAQLSNAAPCDLEAVVTFASSGSDSGFIHDGTDGMYFENQSSAVYRSGDRVRIRGLFAGGLFAPIVAATNIDVVGTNHFPEPLRMSFNQLLQGHGDSRWVEIEGQVMAVVLEKVNAALTLRQAGIEYQAYIPMDAMDTNQCIVGADLRMQGVVGSLFDKNGRFLSIHLLIPNRQCIRRIDQRDDELRSLPLTSIGSILKYDPGTALEEISQGSPLPIRIRGVVTYGPIEGSLFVQDTTGGIEVFSPRTLFYPWVEKTVPRFSFPGLQVGKEVEVIGFPAHEFPAVRLLSGSVGSKGDGIVPSPQPITDLPGNSWPSGVMVDLEAMFLDNFNQGDFGIGVLKTTNGILVEARHALGSPRLNWWQPFRNHSVVHVSGVIQSHAIGPGMVIEHTIWLRDRSDIRLVKNGPWPTASQARKAARIGAVGAVVALAWGGVLTLKLRRRRRELEAEFRTRQEISLELREQAGGQRAILEALTSAVLRMDRSGKVLSYNSATLSVLRLSASELETLNWREAVCAMVDAEGKPVSYDEFPLSRTFSSGESSIGRVFGVDRSDGRRQWLLISTAPVARDHLNAVEVAVVTISDATDQQQGRLDLIRAREVAEAANQAKTEFLAVMSHEIRTPLNGVIGFTDLLLQVPLEEDARRFATTIKESGEALLSVVNEVLDFSKIEAGHLELEREVFPLIQTVEEVVTSLSARAAAKKLELVVDIDPAVGPEWVGDGGRFRQILTNLVGNAVKFTSQGTVELVVDRREDGGLRFEVRDTGSGMSAPELELLFQKFSQVRRSALPNEGGTGLGLAIVKQLVELMQGTVGCESELGQGSIFWFTLPPMNSAAMAHMAPPQLLDLGGARLLLMSGSEPVRRALTRRLSAWRLQVDVAANATEAISRLNAPGRSDPPYELLIWDRDTSGDEPLPEVLRHGFRDPADSTAPAPLSIIEIRSGQQRTYLQSYSPWHMELWKPVVFPDALRQALMTIWAAARFRSDDLPRRRPKGRPQVIVIEDDRVNAMLAAYLLNRLSCDVQIAASREEALSLCRDTSFDLILVNGTSPGFDGSHIVSDIRAVHSRYQRIPIVAMVHLDRPEDERRFRSSGFNGVIAKPLRAGELQALMARWFEGVPVSSEA
jgi:signal transduction histidine kinase/CheY-like chemotaxis protein